MIDEEEQGRGRLGECWNYTLSKGAHRLVESSLIEKCSSESSEVSEIRKNPEITDTSTHRLN